MPQDAQTQTSPLRAVGRYVMHRLREAALYPRMAVPASTPRIVFLPSDVRTMSSLLRGYNMAEAFQTMGWNPIVLPKQLDPGQRRRILRFFRPDMAVLLGSRLPANSRHLLEGIPYVYDLDDADFHNPALEEEIRADVTRADGVAAGSRYIANWCEALNPNTTIIWTGSPDIEPDWTDHTQREGVVTWAQSAPTRYKLEFAFVTDVMERVAAARPGVKFRLYGCGPEDADHPLVQRLRAAGVDVELKPFMDGYADFIASLQETAVGLSAIIPSNAFSKGKSFGKILAYLSAGVPVIASDEVDHGAFFRPETGIVSNDPEVWAEKTIALLDDPALRNAMVQAAHADFRKHLTTEVAAEQLDRLCRAILEARKSAARPA
ncbi:glycosyltransferase family protein [Tropicimonas sp. S265A]|uniref:glycosyltransferase family protein n=1 Tax=Tropicimonas sp. S265A TaxID=3415134 RepID=UPI003C7D7D48